MDKLPRAERACPLTGGVPIKTTSQLAKCNKCMWSQIQDDKHEHDDQRVVHGRGDVYDAPVVVQDHVPFRGGVHDAPVVVQDNFPAPQASTTVSLLQRSLLRRVWGSSSPPWMPPPLPRLFMQPSAMYPSEDYVLSSCSMQEPSSKKSSRSPRRSPGRGGRR